MALYSELRDRIAVVTGAAQGIGKEQAVKREKLQCTWK